MVARITMMIFKVQKCFAERQQREMLIHHKHCCCLLVVVLSSIVCSDASLSYECTSPSSPSLQGSVTVFNGVYWMDRDSYTYTLGSNAVLVDIQSNVQLFDFCNLDSYSVLDVTNLLRSFNVSHAQPWIAVFDPQVGVSVCQEASPYPTTAHFSLYWIPAFLPLVQEIGASGLLWPSTWVHPITPYQIIVPMDADRQSVMGVPIRIPSFFMHLSPEARRMLSLVSAPPLSYGNPSATCTVKLLTPDYNPVRDLAAKGSAFSICGYLVASVNVANIVWCGLLARRIYYRVRAQSGDPSPLSLST
jgi:hypothetical protein